MFTLRFLWIAAALSAMFLAGCGTPVYRQGNLTQGVFETSVPENFTGAGKEFAAGSSIKGVSLSFDYTTEEEMKMKNVKNAELKEGDYDPLISGSDDDKKIMSETKLKKFSYKRNRFPVSAAFTHLFKAKDELAWGYSIGLDPGFYARVIGGINKKNFEVGAYFDIEFYNVGDISFDYYECSAPTKEGCKDITEEKHLEEENVRQGRLGAGIFTSFYVNGLAISYSPLLYVPTIEQEYELQENDPHGNTLRTRVDNPFILSQYAGVSKWIDEHWKVSLGATVLSSLYFNDFYLTANASLGFWF